MTHAFAFARFVVVMVVCSWGWGVTLFFQLPLSSMPNLKSLALRTCTVQSRNASWKPQRTIDCFDKHEKPYSIVMLLKNASPEP